MLFAALPCSALLATVFDEYGQVKPAFINADRVDVPLFLELLKSEAQRAEKVRTLINKYLNGKRINPDDSSKRHSITFSEEAMLDIDEKTKVVKDVSQAITLLAQLLGRTDGDNSDLQYDQYLQAERAFFERANSIEEEGHGLFRRAFTQQELSSKQTPTSLRRPLIEVRRVISGCFFRGLVDGNARMCVLKRDRLLPGRGSGERQRSERGAWP